MSVPGTPQRTGGSDFLHLPTSIAESQILESAKKASELWSYRHKTHVLHVSRKKKPFPSPQPTERNKSVDEKQENMGKQGGTKLENAKGPGK